MKVVAGRPQDIEDAKALLAVLKISDVQEVFNLIVKCTR